MNSDEQIMAELANAIKGLWYMSESDYPFEPVCLKQREAPSPGELRAMAGAEAGAEVETKRMEEFFREGAGVRVEGEGSGSTATPASFEAVIQVLTENLEEIRVYRIGNINIPVFVLGRSPSGTWLGLRTRVVET